MEEAMLDIQETDETTEETMVDILLDWFETIEEIELTAEDRQSLAEVAASLESVKEGALGMGIQTEDFDEWLRFDVLEHWSNLMADVEEVDSDMEVNMDAVTSFHQFVVGGEQRLYFQMLKRCLPVSHVEAAV